MRLCVKERERERERERKRKREKERERDPFSFSEGRQLIRKTQRVGKEEVSNVQVFGARLLIVVMFGPLICRLPCTPRWAGGVRVLSDWLVFRSYTVTLSRVKKWFQEGCDAQGSQACFCWYF